MPRARTLDAWRAIFADHGLIWAPVQTLKEATHDPQARAAGVFTPVAHPKAGSYETVAPPIRLSGFEMRGELGAHPNARVRLEDVGDHQAAGFVECLGELLA